MYDRENIRNITDGMDWVRPMVHNDMSDGQRRLIVIKLREIATELDCLKPVGNPLFADALDPTTYPEDAPIPAAPGPDYATQKQLDALRASVNGADWVTRDFVLDVLARVEVLEKDLLGDEHVFSVSQRVAMIENMLPNGGVAIFKNRPQGSGPISYQEAVNELYGIISGAHPRIARRLDHLEEVVGSDCRSGIPAPVNTIDRQHLYNQAYLVALPVMIRLGHLPMDCADQAHGLAIASMEYLK